MVETIQVLSDFTAYREKSWDVSLLTGFGEIRGKHHNQTFYLVDYGICGAENSSCTEHSQFNVYIISQNCYIKLKIHLALCKEAGSTYSKKLHIETTEERIGRSGPSELCLSCRSVELL